jgi:hypothetical protein
MPNHRAFKTAALAEVNRHILDAGLDSIEHDLPWEFFCECGHAACGEYVELEIEEFVALQERGGAVLAPGHSLPRAERLRRVKGAAGF